MNGSRKRIFAWLLCASMLVTMLPSVAFAEDAPSTVTIHQVTAEEAADGGAYEQFSMDDIIAVSDAEGVDAEALNAVEGADSTWSYGAENVNVTVECIPNNQFQLSGSIGRLTLDDANGQITNVTLMDGTAVEEINELKAEISCVLIAGGATVTIGGVEYANGTDASLAVPRDIAFTGENVTVTMGGSNSYTLEGAPSVTYTGTSAVAITGDVDTLSATGGTVTVDGKVELYSQTKAGTPTITITGDLGSVSTNNNNTDNGIATVIQVYGQVTGKMESIGGSTSAVHMEIGKTDPVKFMLHDEPNGEVRAIFQNNTLTVDNAYTGQYVMAEGDILYDVVVKNGLFDANEHDIQGDVTFLGECAKGEIKSGDTLDQNGTVLGDIMFEDGATGFVNMTVPGAVWNAEQKTAPSIFIGKSATAKFSRAQLTDPALSHTGAFVETIGNEATVVLRGDETSIDRTLIAAVGTEGYGPKATFQLAAATRIFGWANSQHSDNAPFEITDGADVTLQWLEADTLSSPITVGSAAKLTVSGVDKDGRLTLAQGEEQIVLKDGVSADERTTLTLNYCTAKDGGTQKLNALCLREGKLTAINIVNTNLDDVEINTPGGQTGEGGGTADAAPESITVVGENITVNWDAADPDKTADILDGEEVIGLVEADATTGTTTIYYLSSYALSNVTVGDKVIDSLNPQAIAAMSFVPNQQTKVVTLTKTGGKAVSFTLTKIPVDPDEIIVGNGEVISDDVVTFNDGQGNMTYHENTFRVATGQKMEIVLEVNSGIAAGSTFDLAAGSTLRIVDKTPNTPTDTSYNVSVQAPLVVDKPNVTIELENVLWVQNSKTMPDQATIRFAETATNAKLVIEGKTYIINPNATADEQWSTEAGSSITADSPNHDQCPGVYNKSTSLTVEVKEDGVLDVRGGTGLPGKVNQGQSFIGGAGIYNAANAQLTFTGEGIAMVKGGTGGIGSSWTQAGANANGYDGHTGGMGGAAICNMGRVTNAMTSKQWSQGQLVVIGGQGGQGGQGQQAGHVTAMNLECNPYYDGEDKGYTHNTMTIGGRGGQGGNSGYGVIGEGTLETDSGVLLAYSGTQGAGGFAGSADGTNADYCTATPDLYKDSHSKSGSMGQSGSDNAVAIAAEDMLVKGGTIYAQGGTDANHGINLTGTATISGGTVYANPKTNNGYDDAADACTDVWGQFVSDNAGFNGTKKNYETGTGSNADGAAYARVKFAGLEGDIYRVVNASITCSVGGKNTDTYQYGTQDVYVNPQGFAYFYMPENANAEGQNLYNTTIDSIVVEDSNGVRYQLHSEKPVTLNSATRDQNNNYIQLTGTWGEEFEVDGKTCYSGVDMTAAEEIGKLEVRNDPYPLDTPEKLAALAYVNNVLGKDFTNIDFKLIHDLDLSKLLWANPIGTAENPFQGIIAGGANGQGFGKITMRTISGLRMPANYENDVYGLFGYTNGANISYLTISGEKITGQAYVRTLQTAYSDTSRGMTKDSGGQYTWTVGDMSWDGKVDYMGAVAAHAKDTTIVNCSVKRMTMKSVNPTGGDVCIGGLVGWMQNGALTGTLIASTAGSQVVGDTITAVCAESGKAYAGGVVGYVDGASISNLNLGGSSSDAVIVTAQNGSETYAGGVAGKAANSTISDFPNAYLDALAVTAEGASTANYAGGVTGSSENTAFSHVLVGNTVTNVVPNTIKAVGTENRAGGLTAVSANDVVKDVQIIGGGSDGVSAEGGNSGGFAATASGSRFYRSFVRGMSVTGKSYVHLIQTANNVEMYGCYAQGCVAGSNAFRVVNGGKYVGCYATSSAWMVDSESSGGKFYNCYFIGDDGAASADDEVVALPEAVLKAEAIAVMNDELMKREGDNRNANNSGFDWASAYGEPIMYQNDAGNVNDHYPIHGEMVKLIVTVSEGRDYLAEKDWIEAAPASVVFGADGSYWVAKDTNVTIQLHAAYGVTIKSGEYRVNDGEYGPADMTDGQTIGVLNADTIVDFKVVPMKYYRYAVDLKDSSSTGMGHGTGSSVTVTLSGSTVVKQESTDKAFTEPSEVTDSATIHNIILAASENATLTVPTLPSGWEMVSSKANYRQYKSDAGTTARVVEDFVKQVQVTFKSSSKGTFPGEVNLLVSEWSAWSDLSRSFWNGHYYAVETSSLTWAQADAIVRSQRSLLGGMNGSLAVVDSAAENTHLTQMNAAIGWIAANDAASEGAWVNATPNRYIYGDNVAAKYTNWYTGEPNNAGEENYAAINFGAVGKWNDYSGTYKLAVAFTEYGGVETMNASGGSDAYSFTLTYTGGGGSSGGGSGSSTQPIKPVDPEVTGVADKLNTADHMAYLMGYQNGEFGPDQNMTRAEAAMMFYRLLKNKNVTITKSFADVPEDAWYATAVNTLASMGIINGIGNGQFAPNRSITRAQFVAIAMRFADELTPGTRTFKDVPVSYWAYDYIMAATGYGWISGYSNGTFNPNGTVTRAQVTTIVNHMLGRAADEGFVDGHLDDLVTFPDVKSSYWAYYDVLEATNAHDYTKTSGVESWKNR